MVSIIILYCKIVVLYYNIEFLWDHRRICGPSLNEMKNAAHDCSVQPYFG